jgi:CO dehydrogenase/acetyl-CoA synthase delta subunit
VLKAILLDKKPKIEFKSKEEDIESVSIEDIKVAIEALNLKYKRVDELDIYNILNYIESSSKERE